MGPGQAWESPLRGRELSLWNYRSHLPGRPSGTRQVGTSQRRERAGSMPLTAVCLNELSLTHLCLPCQELQSLGNVAPTPIPGKGTEGDWEIMTDYI